MPGFDFRRVARGLKGGYYNLLLGSGVSLDSENRLGPLPSAGELRDRLCTMKGARSSSSLQRVYSTLTPSEIESNVTDIYKESTAGPSLELIPSFLWRRIFTFNIDDALEDAYARFQALQAPDPVNFNDDYKEYRDLSSVPIVHLHGFVKRPDAGYVFSTAEYARNIRAINPWMMTLSQFLPVEPFIIAGASLDEVDLEYYLAGRSEVSARDDRGPSILVEPFPDGVTRKDCEKYDLLLYEGTSKEFFAELSAAVPARPTPAGLVPKRSKDLFPAGTSQKIIVPFHADFELVPPDADAQFDVPKFLYGNQITWNELSADLDISRPGTDDLIDYVRDAAFGERKDKLVIIDSEAGSGKTSVIRRVGYELAQLGITVLNCSPLSRLESALTAEAIDLIDDPVVVLVDNFADQAFQVADIISRLEKPDVVFLGAEREYRWRYILKSLGGLDYGKAKGLELNATQAERLIDLYTRHGLVGDTRSLSERASAAKALAIDPIAVACCRILGDFKPLDRIIDSLVKDAGSVALERYVLTALANFCFRGGVRYEILAGISGRKAWSEQFASHHPLPLTYADRSDKSYIVPLNITLSDRVLRSIAAREREKLLKAFIDLANAIAPRVNRGSIMRRTPEARLAGRLFDYDAVASELLGDLAERFYEETQDAWQWNSRYWEQVALLQLASYRASPDGERGKLALKQAAQHARHAVATEEHPLSLTTLGKVLLAHLDESDYDRTSIYDEAFSRLSYAIEKEKRMSRVSVHPFVSLFRGTQKYLGLGEKPSDKQKESLRAFMKEAKRQFRRDREVQAAVEDLEAVL